MLVKIFSNFSRYEITVLEGVCKRFRFVCRSNDVWKKFLMTSQGIHLPKKVSKKLAFQYMWANSIIIGKERWYPVMLPDLATYEQELRKEEMQKSAAASQSKLVVYHRLNPVYPFATKCINDEGNSAMVQMVQLLFDYFRHIDEMIPEEREGFYDYQDCFIRDGRTCIMWANYVNKSSVSMEILYNLESCSFLNPSVAIKVDSSGNRINLDGVNYRLNADLFYQIKAIIDKSRNYAYYPCNHGCMIHDADAKSFPYSRTRP